MTNAKFIAELSVDIMDRNLYERANDCRWWALTTACREKLAQASISEIERQELTDIIVYINELYTVYTNIYIYDNNRKIVATSNSEQVHLIGQHADPATGAAQALKVADSQRYTVSDFLPTAYYDNKHTYIYNASITALDNSNKVVGGIGIVFDSEPEFQGMLQDTLPKDDSGEVLAGCFGLFVDAEGMVISASEGAPLHVGDHLPLAEHHLFELEPGESESQILAYADQQYIVGVAASKGYREYKTTGDYCNDVRAAIFIPL
jgi:hypothetical protein